jgi:hypothetical protein
MIELLLQSLRTFATSSSVLLKGLEQDVCASCGDSDSLACLHFVTKSEVLFGPV